MSLSVPKIKAQLGNNKTKPGPVHAYKYYLEGPRLSLMHSGKYGKLILLWKDGFCMHAMTVAPWMVII